MHCGGEEREGEYFSAEEVKKENILRGLVSIKVSCQNTAAVESRVTNAAPQTKVCRKEESQTCINQPNKPILFSTLTFL